MSIVNVVNICAYTTNFVFMALVLVRLRQLDNRQADPLKCVSDLSERVQNLSQRVRLVHKTCAMGSKGQDGLNDRLMERLDRLERVGHSHEEMHRD